MSTPDTMLMTLGLAGISADNLLVTPTGGTQGTLASLLVPDVAPAARYLNLVDVKTDTGLSMITATAATTLPGIARTAGTSMYLTGAATSGATPATTKMVWQFALPTTYIAGANIPVQINTVVPTATDVTAASTTTTLAAYTEAAGVEAALTVSAAQETPITTAATLTFTITGTGLIPGQLVTLEVTSLVTTTSGGASSMELNSIAYQA